MSCKADNPNCGEQNVKEFKCNKCDEIYYRCPSCGAVVPNTMICLCYKFLEINQDQIEVKSIAYLPKNG